MKDAARIQTAIEILDELFDFSQPADNTVNVFFRTHRYIGGGDRRKISDIVWRVLRCYGRLTALCGEKPTGRKAVSVMAALDKMPVAELFNGEKYAPTVLSDEEKAFLSCLPSALPAATLEVPEWLKGRIDAADVAALTENAPFDLRVNTLKATRDDVRKMLAAEGIEAQETPLSPVGLRVGERVNVKNLDIYNDGLVEIQDEGSQIVSLLSQAKAGQIVIDWCAGGGGKTLALSAMMQAKGTLYAVDNDVKRMRDLPERAGRAGANNVILLNDYKSLKQYDLVLVDAPCTGTGTWRRAPDARWRTTESQSAEIVKIQRQILDKASANVKKGGRLFYITCSLDTAENEQQAAAFLAAHPEFEQQDLSPVFKEITGKEINTPTVRLSPSIWKTDGFFAASFVKK